MIYIESGSIGTGFFDLKREDKIAYLVRGSRKIRLSGNLTSVQIVSQQTQTGGGVSGAAGGAVLGFLIAGPLGTAVGAGMGSKKKGINKTTYSLTFADGNYATTSNLKPNTVAKLQAEIGRTVPEVKEDQKKLTKQKKSIKPKENENTPAHGQVKKNKKPAADYFNVSKKKGRRPDEKIVFEEPEILNNWLRMGNKDDELLEHFINYLKEIIKKYHKFKWLYFDRVAVSDEEINSLSIIALNNIAAYKYQINAQQKNIKKIKPSLEKEQKKLDALNVSVEEARTDFENSGFFNKGKLEKRWASVSDERYSQKKLFSSIKTKLSNSSKKLEQLERDFGILISGVSDSPINARGNKPKVAIEKFMKINDLEKKISDLTKKLSIKGINFLRPNEKSKTLKKYNVELDYQEDVFLVIYREHFEKTENEWYQNEIEKQKKEDESKQQNKKNTSKKINVELDEKKQMSTKTKKERLLELKELLDEGLISEDEFSRKKDEIISDI